MKQALKLFFVACLFVLFLTSCGPLREQHIVSSSTDGERRTTAFVDVNLIPMTEEIVVGNQTVLVQGTRIAAIGPSGEVRVPGNVRIIDGSGAYLMPGLADMHMHTREDWLSVEWPVSPLKLYLANGVTTIRDFGPRGRALTYALRWREDIKEGHLVGPTLYTSGLRPGHPSVGPAQDPRKIVQKNKAQGFDFLKLYSFLSTHEFQKAMTTAKQLGMYTAGHIPFAIGLDGVLAAGMDEIAHIEELAIELLGFDRTKHLQPQEWFRYIIELAVQQHKTSFGLEMEELEEQYRETIAAMVDKVQSANTPVCTTLVVDAVIVQKLFEKDTFLARPKNKYLPQWYMDAFRQGREKHQVQFKGHEDFAPFKYAIDGMLLMALRHAGVRLLLSTDAGSGGMGLVPGFSIHDELRILTEHGFTPYEAIATGTVQASKVVEAMTGEDDFGTIEVGKRADFILVHENPLEDVANIKNLRGVMAAGRWYSKETVDQMTSI